MKASLIFILIASLVGNFYQFQRARDVESGGKPHVDAVDTPIVMRTPGGLLEVSTIKVVEQFSATKQNTILSVPVGNTITQIRVPVVYRYHIRLASEWKIHIRDKTFIVISPPIKPSLPIAIETGGMLKQSSGVWSVINGNSLLNTLQRSISPTLASRAESPAYVGLQREASRKTVTEFVSKWLIKQEQWASSSAYPIRVYFSDEPIQVLGM